jgi:glycosyltransferase involved in cell wall biosynthesis
MGLSCPKFILLTHEFPPFRGGVASFCRDLALGLAENDALTEVWAPQGTFPTRSAWASPFPNLTVRRFSGSGRLTPTGLWAMRRAFRQAVSENPEGQIILASYGAICGHLLSLAIPGATSLAWVLHGSEILKWEKNGLWRFLACRAANRVGTVFCNSEFTKKRFHTFIGAAISPKIEILKLGPGTSSFTDSSTGSRPHGDRLRLLCLARLHPRKGQLELAHALHLLPQADRSRLIFQLAGAGDSEYLELVVKTAQAARVEVEVLGPIADEQLGATYAQADIYAMTPITLNRSVEGFGMTFLEAGLKGKPVLGYRSGGVAEAVQDGVTGFLVDEGDQVALAQKLSDLINNPGLREQMGSAGLQFAKGRSWQQVGRAVVQAMASEK